MVKAAPSSPFVPAAIGSTLLRAPGRSRPVQEDRNGATRSTCPSERANALTEATRRESLPSKPAGEAMLHFKDYGSSPVSDQVDSYQNFATP